MRLWHQKLIPHLPRQQLLGQHRELCALRGNRWGKKHTTVDYVFCHDPACLIAYHYLVMDEMRRRGYNPSHEWMAPCWRGDTLEFDNTFVDAYSVDNQYCCATDKGEIIYPEHNDAYLQECLENLKGKGIDLYGVVDI